jgi:hypothetical protein
MSTKLFDLSSPRDMLNKANRELVKLKVDLDIDKFFNCFASLYHVMDYVKAHMPLHQPVEEAATCPN